MPYKHYQPDKPVMTDTGQQVIDTTRENLMAMRDAVVMGTMTGWDGAPAGADPDYPDTLTYSKGTERLRLTLTWGSGATEGYITAIVYDYSPDAGVTWQSLGTAAVDYSTAFPQTTWS